jgi:hypothetical protein
MTFNKKEYMKEYMKEYRLKNKESINKQVKKYFLKNKEHIRKWQKAYLKEYCLKNKEHLKEYKKEYYSKNLEHIKELQTEWNSKNRVRFHQMQNAYTKKRRRTDPSFRLKLNLRTRIWNALKGKNKSASTMELIGCTIEELWVHLESSPKWELWMTRENYGGGRWDVDHIKACAKFDFTDPAQQRICCHWSNLQPMEHIANIKKGSR